MFRIIVYLRVFDLQHIGEPGITRCSKICQMNLEKELSDRDLTQEKLFSLYEVALSERFPTAEIETHPPESFQVKLPGKEIFTIYIKNLWLTVRRQTAEGRIKVFENHLHSIQTTFAADKKPNPRREDIVPIIKDSEYLSFAGEGKSLMREHLAGDIWIIYALDLPDSIVTLKPEIVQELGLTPAELQGLACSNLRRILPEVKQHGSGPWYLLTAGGDYVASILLLDEVWAELEESVDGDIVAAAPSRDILLVTGSRSKKGLEYVRLKAREIAGTGDHVISQTLLRRSAGSWKVFE